MNLLEQVLELLSSSTALNLVNRTNIVVNIACILCHTHIRQLLQLFTLWHTLQRVSERD